MTDWLKAQRADKQRLLDARLQEYEAISKRLENVIDPIEETRLKRQKQELKAEITELTDQLKEIDEQSTTREYQDHEGEPEDTTPESATEAPLAALRRHLQLSRTQIQAIDQIIDLKPVPTVGALWSEEVDLAMNHFLAIQATVDYRISFNVAPGNELDTARNEADLLLTSFKASAAAIERMRSEQSENVTYSNCLTKARNALARAKKSHQELQNFADRLTLLQSAQPTQERTTAPPLTELYLDGQQIKKLCNLLTDAFPTFQEMERMVATGLNENLEKIAGTGKLDDVTFALVKHYKARGELHRLIMAAQKERTHHPGLKTFVEELKRGQ